MVSGEDWVDIGSAEELASTPLKSCKARAIPLAISFKDGGFGAVSNICNHVGGPLGEGRLDGDYITCPWHGWKFHRLTGVGEPGFEEDRVPAFPGEGRERPRARQRRGAVAAYQSAAQAASALAPARTRAGATASRWHLDDRHGHDQPALLGLRLSARLCPQVGGRVRRRDAAHPAQRSQVPRLRGLLFEGGAGLHLALLDHANGCERRVGPRL